MKWTQLHTIFKLPHTNVTNTPLANLHNAIHNLNILACCSKLIQGPLSPEAKSQSTHTHSCSFTLGLLNC